MHQDELVVGVSLVRQLVATQFPQWAALPIQTVESVRTDNTLFRLGTDMVIRLPRVTWA